MTEAQKLTALDAMETQYDEGIAYIDAMMHDSVYFTQAEMDATYYRGPSHPSGRSDEGHGSGVDAASVDGYTLAAIQQQALPPGCITFWCGSQASIPTNHGWNLWTPGKGKFIMAAGLVYEEESENDIDYVYPETAGGFTSTGTAITGTQIANHVHVYPDRAGCGVYPYGAATGAACSVITYANRTTTTVDNLANAASAAHTHECTLEWTGYYDSENVLHNGPLDLYPHYKALCWVIKS